MENESGASSSPSSAEAAAALRTELHELKGKMERWKEQSKLGIEQHRNRIKELTKKLNCSVSEKDQVMKLNDILMLHLKNCMTHIFELMVRHETEVYAAAHAASRSAIARLVGSYEVRYRAKLSQAEKCANDKDEILNTLEEKIDDYEEKIQSLTIDKVKLEGKVEKLTSQENLRESIATREAVSLAVKAAQENFDADLLSLRIDYENQINEMRVLHEEEISRIQAESALASQAYHEAPAANPIIVGSGENTDDSYVALFEANKALELDVAALREENDRLRKEIFSLQKISKGGGKTDSVFASSAHSGLPHTLEEAQMMIMEMQGREKTLRGSLGELQLQYGALKEHPPLPQGAMSPEDKKYLKVLILNLYSAKDRDHLMKSLAPVIGKLLDLSDIYQKK